MPVVVLNLSDEEYKELWRIKERDTKRLRKAGYPIQDFIKNKIFEGETLWKKKNQTISS